jgi:hypothetical protein
MSNIYLKRGYTSLIFFIFIIGIIIPSISGHIVNSNSITRNYYLQEKLSSTSPPTEEWNKTFHYINGWGNCVQETPDNCYIVVGTCGIGYWWDAFLLKVDQDGNELWNYTYGDDGSTSTIDSGWWVEVTNDGNYILVGGRDHPGGTNDRDIWLIKTDSNGAMLWNKTYPGEFDDEGTCVKQTEDGGYIITGWFNDKLCLLKTNENGDLLWYTLYGEYYSRGYSVLPIYDFGYLVTGSYDLDPEYLWLVRTDSNGLLIWEVKFRRDCGAGNCYYNCGRRMEYTSDNGLIIGGYTDSYGAGETDYWLIKLGPDLNEWNQTFGTPEWDYGYSAIETADGGYIIGGCKDWPEKFWLVRTDGYGQMIWNEVYFPSERGRCYCIQKTKDDGYIATGVINLIFDGPTKCVLVKLGPDIQNNPPSKPTIDGPKNGKVGETYEYTFNSSDEDGQDVSYYVNWGDGSYEIVHPAGPTGTEAKASHMWEEPREYYIFARTKDVFGAVSPWSDAFPVTIPRNRIISNSIFTRIFNRFLNAFPLLQYIFGSKS